MPLATIGRLGGGADIEIDDRQVSRLHCALEVKDSSVLLRDLRSTNGTYVADQRVLSAKLETSWRVPHRWHHAAGDRLRPHDSIGIRAEPAAPSPQTDFDPNPSRAKRLEYARTVKI